MNRRVTGAAVVVCVVASCATAGAAKVGPPPSGQAALAVSVAVRHGAVALVGAGGSGVRVLAVGTGAGQLVNPAWSPNGKRLAYTITHPAAGLRAADSVVYVRTIPNGNARALTARRPGRLDDDAAFAPNGTAVLFSRATAGPRGGSRLMIVSSTFGPPTALTSGRAGRQPVQDSDPAWAPNGRVIAFTRQTAGGTPSIWLMDYRGHGAHRIIGNGRSPTWAPDGKHIAFVSARDRHGRCGRRFCGELYIARADGSVQRRLTRTTLNESDPAWSPDGSLIAYTRGGGAAGQPPAGVYTVDPTGACAFRVTGTATVMQPAWRPHLAPPGLPAQC
jgi:Tol biopolymer transport system component